MSRPLRNAYAGGYFHIGTRGNNKQAIYLDGVDRYWFLEMFGKTTLRYEWSIYAYCLMTNHYHAVLCIPEGGLSEGMCELNGGFARWSNMRHGRCDHLFGKRFSSREITTDEYLLEACRYVVLNPVRAGLVKHPEEWTWSSYRACVGLDFPLKWFSPTPVLQLFSTDPQKAMEQYRRFVEEGLVEEGRVSVPVTQDEVTR